MIYVDQCYGKPILKASRRLRAEISNELSFLPPPADLAPGWREIGTIRSENELLGRLFLEGGSDTHIIGLETSDPVLAQAVQHAELKIAARRLGAVLVSRTEESGDICVGIRRMNKMTTIKIRLGLGKAPVVEVDGAMGNACKTMTGTLVGALGAPIDEELKPEYHMPTIGLDQTQHLTQKAG